MLKVLLIAFGGSSLFYLLWRYSLLAAFFELLGVIAEAIGDINWD